MITWTGATSNNWDFVDANWSTNPYGTPNQNVQVAFTNTGLNTTINVNSATIAPVGGMVLSNSTVAYTLAGNPVGGPGRLGHERQFNSGNLDSASNTYAGATVINAGTFESSKMIRAIGTVPAAATRQFTRHCRWSHLRVTTPRHQAERLGGFTVSANRGIAVGGGTHGGGTINVVNAGATANTVTYAGIVADVAGQTGVLNKSGNGELDLSGPNTFSGGLNVNAGSAIKLLTRDCSRNRHDDRSR